jgi:hypothetical protein
MPDTSDVRKFVKHISSRLCLRCVCKKPVLCSKQERVTADHNVVPKQQQRTMQAICVDFMGNNAVS